MLAIFAIILIFILCVGLLNVGACVSLPKFKEKSSDVGMLSLDSEVDLIQEKIDCYNMCKSINLNIKVVPKIRNLDVLINVSDPKFNDCFEYYNIILKNLKNKDENAEMVQYDKKKGASYLFKNVGCGTYNITIQTCATDWDCPSIFVSYPESVNMTGSECVGFQLDNQLLPQQQDKKIIAIITVISVLLFLAVGAVSFCFYFSAEQKGKLKNLIFKKKEKKNRTVTAVEDVYHFIPKSQQLIRKNEVTILHYHNEQNNSKVHLLQDFLQETYYYESITTITSSLSSILFDVTDWLDKMSETSKVDGGVHKIILIASEIDAEARDYEMENLLFSKILDKINDDTEKCLRGYNHLFVVQFDMQLTNYPEEFRNIVRRDRYTLSGLFEDQLIDLCINLCSESEQNVPHSEFIEKNLRELFSRHPIRHLGNQYLDV